MSLNIQNKVPGIGILAIALIPACSSGLQTFSQDGNKSVTSAETSSTQTGDSGLAPLNTAAPSLTISRSTTAAFGEISVTASGGDIIKNVSRVEFDMDDDGSPDESWVAPADGTPTGQPSANFVFYEAGIFHAKAKIYDAQGNATEASVTLQVAQPSIQEYLSFVKEHIVTSSRISLNDQVVFDSATSLLKKKDNVPASNHLALRIFQINLLLRKISRVETAIEENIKTDIPRPTISLDT